MQTAFAKAVRVGLLFHIAAGFCSDGTVSPIVTDAPLAELLARSGSPVGMQAFEKLLNVSMRRVSREPNGVIMYRGNVSGASGSSVWFSVSRLGVDEVYGTVALPNAGVILSVDSRHNGSDLAFKCHNWGMARSPKLLFYHPADTSNHSHEPRRAPAGQRMRRGGPQSPEHRSCPVFLDVDSTFFSRWGGEGRAEERRQRTHEVASIVLSAVNDIYWRQLRVRLPLAGVHIREVPIPSTPTSGDAELSAYETWLVPGSSRTAAAAARPRGESQPGARDVCANILLVNRNLMGTVGRANMGMPRSGIVGGVCERYLWRSGASGRYHALNTGIVNSQLYRSELSISQLVMILAHELGHMFGAPHTCSSGCATVFNQCNPSVNNGGRFLMYPAMTSDANSLHFSSCSITAIEAMIRAKGQCFEVQDIHGDAHEVATSRLNVTESVTDAPTLVVTDAPTTSAASECTQETDVDYYGNDISNSAIPGQMSQTMAYTMCSQKCILQQGCACFTIVYNRCYLKWSTAGRQHSQGALSGNCISTSSTFLDPDTHSPSPAPTSNSLSRTPSASPTVSPVAQIPIQEVAAPSPPTGDAVMSHQIENTYTLVGHGCCRTASLGQGSPQDTTASSLAACQIACNEIESCTAIEYQQHRNLCEIHSENMVQVAESNICVCFSRTISEVNAVTGETITSTSGTGLTAAPTIQVPSTGAPSTGAPSTGAPSTVTPLVHMPTTVAPTTFWPTSVSPTHNPPSTILPTILPPSTPSPSTVQPTVLPLLTQPPSTATPSVISTASMPLPPEIQTSTAATVQPFSPTGDAVMSHQIENTYTLVGHGCCRTASLGQGSPQDTTASSLAACQIACNEIESCTAIEYQQHRNLCEIHSENMVQVAESNICVCFSRTISEVNAVTGETITSTSGTGLTAAPTIQVPSTGAPSTGAPSTGAPSTVTPLVHMPTTVAPTTFWPTSVSPTHNPPSTILPTILPPSTPSPSTVQPTVLPLLTQPPSTATPSVITINVYPQTQLVSRDALNSTLGIPDSDNIARNQTNGIDIEAIRDHSFELAFDASVSREFSTIFDRPHRIFTHKTALGGTSPLPNCITDCMAMSDCLGFAYWVANGKQKCRGLSNLGSSEGRPSTLSNITCYCKAITSTIEMPTSLVSYVMVFDFSANRRFQTLFDPSYTVFTIVGQGESSCEKACEVDTACAGFTHWTTSSGRQKCRGLSNLGRGGGRRFRRPSRSFRKVTAQWPAINA